MNWISRLLGFREEAEQEHRISIPGMEIAFNHATRTVFLVDQTGAGDEEALAILEKWLKSKGWFIYCVVVEEPTPIKRDMK